MSDQSTSTISLIFDAIRAVFSFLGSINWYLHISRLITIVAFPFRLILYPLRFIFNILLVVFAPAIYAASFTLSGIRSILDFLASLEPLYSFFGAAAGVGIFAGIVLAIFSSFVTSRLGMQDDEEDDGSTTRPSSKQSYIQDSHSQRDYSSTEFELQWLDSASHRRRPRGLLSQTIHEEDDDSEF